MNKAELINTVAQGADLSKKDAEKAIDATIQSIQNALQKRDPVQLVGFGTFEARERAARTGRNPRTGEEIKIPSTVVPAFKPGKKLKEAVSIS